jgi:carbamate kinase
MRVLAAIGGNAFVAPGAALTVEGEFRFAREALVCLEPFFTRGVELLITHGNGPQVGHQLGRAERSRETDYALPLDVCVAQTQGELGYVLALTLREILARPDIERPVAALVTQVEIDEGDEAFQRPSKPVGPFLDAKGAEALLLRGLTIQEDAGRGYRRVVPSPEPRRVTEADAIQLLLAAGVTVVACGGGGVPVVPADRGHRGVEAVVDKDLTSALLADVIGAELLVLLTDVPYAYTGFRTPQQAPVRRITAARARALLSEGHFAPGSMAPKIEACARFASLGGRRAIVCDPPGLPAALRGEGGTMVVPDE